MVYTTKRIQIILRHNILVEIAELLFNISLLVLWKAMSVNYLLLNSLQARQNIFKIHPDYFDVFLGGLEFAEQQKSFANEFCKIQNYANEVEKRITLNNFQNRYSEQMKNQNVEVTVHKKCFKQELAHLSDYCQKIDNSECKDLCRLLRILISRVECVMDSHIFFPYINNKSTLDKFDWVTFSNDFDTASVKITKSGDRNTK